MRNSHVTNKGRQTFRLREKQKDPRSATDAKTITPKEQEVICAKFLENRVLAAGGWLLPIPRP